MEEKARSILYRILTEVFRDYDDIRCEIVVKKNGILCPQVMLIGNTKVINGIPFRPSNAFYGIDYDIRLLSTGAINKDVERDLTELKYTILAWKEMTRE